MKTAAMKICGVLAALILFPWCGSGADTFSVNIEVTKATLCIRDTLHASGNHTCDKIAGDDKPCFTWKGNQGKILASKTKGQTEQYDTLDYEAKGLDIGDNTISLEVTIGDESHSKTASQKVTVIDISEITFSGDIENDSLSPCGIGTASVTVQPAGRTLKWEAVNPQPDPAGDPAPAVDITPDSGTQVGISVKENSGRGKITIQVYDAEHKDCPSGNHPKTKVLTIGCKCADCNPFGGDEHGPTSIHSRFFLGRDSRGSDAGYLLLETNEPSVLLATPAGLRLAHRADEVEVITQATGTNGAGGAVLRQVLAPDGLVDIVTNSDFKYTIFFHKRADVGSKGTNGMYALNPGAQAFVSYAIENPAATTNDIDTLRITRTRGGQAVANEYVWSEEEGVLQWALSSGNGLRVETVSTTTNAIGRIETRTVKDNAGVLVSKTRRTWHAYDWGEEVVETVNDPDGAALTATRGYYDVAETGKYSRLAQIVHADGSWTRYDYDATGRVSVMISSWLDAPTNAAADAARAIYYDFTPVDGNDLGTEFAYSPRAVIEKILGNVVDKTWHAYYTNAAGERVEIEERAASSSAGYGAAGNARSMRIFNSFDTNNAGWGKVKSVSYPDGRQDSYAYTRGSWSSNADPAACAFTPAAGNYLRTTLTHGTINSPNGIANKTTRETTIKNALGRLVQRETYAYDGSGYSRIAWEVNILDDFGRPTASYRSDGSETESSWGCCGKENEKDGYGVENTFSYDALNRLEVQTKEGIAAGEYPAQAALQTTFVYDAEGWQLRATRSAGGLSQIASNQYDLAGRIIRATDEGGLITETSYTDGGRKVTQTLPGGATRITENFRDGKVKSVTGTAQVPQCYDYGVNENGQQWVKVSTGTSGSPVWVKTTADLLGRTAKIEKPGFSTTEITEYFYNNKGQLVKTTISGQPATLYAYDELSNQIRSGLDINGNGVLDLAGMDRITESETFYEPDGSGWWQVNVNRIYAADNSVNATTNSITRQQLTGLGAAGPELVERVASATDINGNETITTTTVDRANKKVTQTTDVPNSTGNDISVTVNGLLVSAQRFTLNAPTLHAYDALGRRTGTTDPRTGTATTHYDNRGWVDYVENAAGNRTTYTYDPATGRRLSESRTVNGEPLTTYFAYTTQGQLEKTWGSGVYPVRYEFDNYGRMTKMHTYRGGSGFNGATWPSGVGDGDITEWIYHEASGLLTAKKDAAGKEVAYTYASGGRLASRTWSRVNGTNSMVTSYFYSPAGDLIAIDYSDSTPDVSFSYDRLGRQKSASSSVSLNTFTYNSALQLVSEAVAGVRDPGTTNIIIRNYDALGRSSGFSVPGVGDPGYSVAYAYDAYGRFSSISSSVSSVSSVVNYSYLPNSDLIAGYSEPSSGLSVSSTYEQNRNLLTQVKNTFDSETISQYDYANDSVGWRVLVKQSGTGFQPVGNMFNLYGYNTRSELVTADRYFGANPNNLENPVPGQSYAYGYDPIGNRQYAMRDNAAWLYTANNLNQYTHRTIPGLADIMGSASAEATVTVNNQPVNRYGAYWHKALEVDNAGSAAYPEVAVVGVYNPEEPGAQDIVSEEKGRIFVARTPEKFTYDADGNMTSDGRFTYRWDAENRLIAVEDKSGSVDVRDWRRFEYTYDYMSRRIGKQYYTWSKPNKNWMKTPYKEVTFIYNGWNVIREDIKEHRSQTSGGGGKGEGKGKGGLPDAGEFTYSTNYYLWGLDLSGSLQDAGGIGGLLSLTRAQKQGAKKQVIDSYFYLYDGNGNVSELINPQSEITNPQFIAAHYEYSPYGETIVATGSLAKDNPFRFSTKYFDDESGMLYYGYRYYSPSLGRFLSRDPVGEEAIRATSVSHYENISFMELMSLYLQLPMNDFIFVNNNANNNIDRNGLQTSDSSAFKCEVTVSLTGSGSKRTITGSRIINYEGCCENRKLIDSKWWICPWVGSSVQDDADSITISAQSDGGGRYTYPGVKDHKYQYFIVMNTTISVRTGCKGKQESHLNIKSNSVIFRWGRWVYQDTRYKGRIIDWHGDADDPDLNPDI